MPDKMTTAEMKKRLFELEAQVHELKQVAAQQESRLAILAQSEKRFRDHIENAPVGIFRISSHGRILSVNLTLARYLGFSSPETALAHPRQLGLQFYYSQDVLDQFIWLAHQYGFVENFESRARTVDGRILWLNVNATVVEYLPDGSFIIDGFASDVTKRKNAEDTLKEREAQLRTLIDTLPDLVWLKNQQGTYLFCNSRFENFFGAKEKDIVGKTDYDFVHKELADFFRKHDRDVIEKEKPVRNEEAVVFAVDGHREILETINKPMYTSEGLLVGVLGIARDITERKHSEAELKRRVEFERQVAQISSGLATIGVSGADFAINRSLAAAGRYTGADRAYVFQFCDYDALLMDNTYEWCADGIEPLISRRKGVAIDNVAPWFAGNLRAKKIICVSDLADSPPEARMERQCVRRHEIRSVIALPMETTDGLKGFIGFDSVRSCRVWTEDDQRLLQFLGETLSHVIERIRAEDKLRQSEEKLIRLKKMESIGLLAGGVAHDLNNVLSGLVSYPELILMTLPEQSKLRNPIRTIHDSGKKAVAIVQDLLTVARGVAIEKQPLNLNHAIANYLRSPEYERLHNAHPKVSVSIDLDPRLMNIKGSQVHIEKAVMNLVSNAAEAIIDTGQVAIRSESRYIDRPLKGFDDVMVGEYAVLIVSDNGPGISGNDIERIFEPFYTKKIMGRSGTGLGLAVVWNVVKDHLGYIDVASDERGTTIKLYFPVTREAIIQDKAPLHLDDYKGNGQRVLVVDDVESQRQLFSMMLDTLGYQVQTVDSGEEALRYLEKNCADIILLDMIMDPGINGRETYERIIKIRPGQKAIIVSGYADTEEVRKAQALGAGKYLKKPVQLEKLGVTIKKELKEAF